MKKKSSAILIGVLLWPDSAHASVGEILGSIQTTFSRGASPQVVLGVALSALVLIALLVLNEIRKADQRERARARVSWDAFYALATERGLTAAEVKTLEQIVNQVRLSHPDSILESAQIFENALDSFYELSGGVDQIVASERKALRSLRGRLGFLPLPVEIPYITTRQFVPSSRIIVEQADLGVAGNAVVTYVEEEEWGISNPFDAKIGVKPGMSLRISLTRGGDAEYSLESQIRDVRGDLLVLEHTRSLRRRQLRNWVRIEVNLPATVVPLVENGGGWRHSGIQLKGRIVDLSGGGLAVRLPVQLQVGARILLDFPLGDQNLTGIDAEIIRIAELSRGDETLYQHSVSFKEIQKSVQERIVRFVFEKQRQDAQWR